MRFRRIEIEEFGKLNDALFLLGEGVNLFEGANESGKSTILAFLRFLLYGFPRKGSGEGEEREKRLSWRGHRAAGSAVIETEEGEFRILRQVTRQGSAARDSYSEQLCVTELSTGKELFLGELSPGEYFLGLPAAIYDSTMCLRQSDAERVSSPDVSDAVSEMLFTGSAGVSADVALDKLRLARKELQHQRGRGGRIAELEDRVAAAEEAVSLSKSDAQELAELHRRSASYKEQVTQRRRELEEISTHFELAAAKRTFSILEQADAAARVQEQKLLHYEALRTRYMQEYGAVEKGIAQAEEALREHRALMPELARVGAELNRVRMTPHNEDMLAAHAIVRERGGAEVVCKDFQSAVRARAGYRKASLICLAITLVLVAVTALIATGVLTPLLALFLPVGDYLPGIVLIGAGVCLPAAVITFVCVMLWRRRAHRARTWMKRLHVEKETMFRTYLEQCANEAETVAAKRELVGEIEGVYAAKEAALRAVRARLAEALGACGLILPEEVEELPAQLAVLEQARCAAHEELMRAHLEYERAAAAREALSRSVAGTNAAELRQKLESAGALDVEDEETLRRKQAFLRESLTGLERKLHEAERAEFARAATAKDPAQEQSALHALQEELSAARARLQALTLAIDSLEQATCDLRDGLAPKLCEAARAHFTVLTGGAHEALHTGTDLSILLDSARGPLPLSHFSAGCRDAAHLSLRLALLETLSDVRLPLLFDEAFSRLDDTRARALLDLLVRYGEEGGQVLLFTCHSREAEFLADREFTYFTLQ